MDQQDQAIEPSFTEPLQGEEAPVIAIDRIAGEPDLIPEKFKGKSIDEFVNSYKSLESEFTKTKKQFGELETKAQEAERLKSELDAVKQQQALLQQQNQVFMQQQSQYSQAPKNDVFNELWENNPADAVKKALQAVQHNIEQKINSREVVNYYNQLKNNVPDFAELEPIMEKVSQVLAPSVDASFRNSPAALDTMYYIAKGLKADELAKKAANKGMEEARHLQTEKNAAMSEGSSSPAPAKDFNVMSATEMRQYLIDHKIAQPGF